MKSGTDYDVIIVGGGPAGLSAALLLGRCRRRVLVCDDGNPRNAASPMSHGVFTRDGTPPAELLRLGREQLVPYGVEVRDVHVTEAQSVERGFQVVLAGGTVLRCRRLLLATGVVDELPRIAGIEPFYGRSVWHCPYCDGWETRDQPLAAYGHGHDGAELALGLKTWTDDVILFTDGGAPPSHEHQVLLRREGIPWNEGRIARLEGSGGQLERVVLVSGEALLRRGLFFHTQPRQRSLLAQSLGCAFTRRGAVKTRTLEDTGIPGLYVAGDAARDLQFVIVAAAEGTKAALAINKSLRMEDCPAPNPPRESPFAVPEAEPAQS
ncbi:NAD(P)/FAD-dependent oxidoreductase [Stigmatella sp. ncwal1]|uniref:NAD(P)/FAD-dependent oxidoreductase n=1 Tax=Stigmatella ashevillensis TaxID=2995309 RepID=A0ABT5DFW1_9BACT|nr:NAD(P)/FAD-dependent oxidoreductase [Stigmatella ashevillena]MDC0712560.1 NAD(P)/FAD-dependent oxidoreductase [Stigmatella ashevillena]